MKLQQLRYFLEVYRCNLNISEAAEILFTSQPGISKQIKLLEDELGVQLFVRHGKRIVAVTPPGQAVLDIAERIFRDVQSIRNIGTEFAEQDSGRLTIATTYTQARHVLPPVVAEFFRQYPKVGLSLLPAEPSAVDRMVAEGLADFAINSEADARHSELRHISARAWNRCVLVPQGHALAGKGRIGLADLSSVPLIGYTDAEQDAALQQAFAGSGLTLPQVALSSMDAGVIKTYVPVWAWDWWPTRPTTRSAMPIWFACLPTICLSHHLPISWCGRMPICAIMPTISCSSICPVSPANASSRRYTNPSAKTSRFNGWLFRSSFAPARLEPMFSGSLSAMLKGYLKMSWQSQNASFTKLKTGFLYNRPVLPRLICRWIPSPLNSFPAPSPSPYLLHHPPKNAPACCAAGLNA